MKITTALARQFARREPGFANDTARCSFCRRQLRTRQALARSACRYCHEMAGAILRGEDNWW